MDLGASLGKNKPAQYPDSLLLPKQLRKVWVEAQEAFQRALDRWLALIKHGTIPEDLNSIH